MQLDKESAEDNADAVYKANRIHSISMLPGRVRHDLYFRESDQHRQPVTSWGSMQLWPHGKIEDLSVDELEVYEAAIENGDYCGSIRDLINLTDNLEGYDYLHGIDNDYDLGYYWVEESGCYDTKELGSLSNYIDYERFGRDIALDEGGTFTKQGYIRSNGNSFYEEYDGINVPDEYRVFSMPMPEKNLKDLNQHKSHRTHDER